MAIDTDQLREYIVTPTLDNIELGGKDADEIVLGTFAKESNMGEFVIQIGGGPALGIGQMEPLTFNDTIINFLDYRPKLTSKILRELRLDSLNYLIADDMVFNLKLATIMCRLHYLRIPVALPKHDDIEGMAKYWKKYYNTPDGKGSVDEFIYNYNLYIGG